MDPAQLLASFKNFQERMALDRPVYSTPPPVESTPQNNECRLVDVHGHKIAAFTINHDEYICLPQAFDLFLKHLVGGLHTVYTKLKRLSITPLVCNVEQVRTLRGLGAIQPGVNRCKLITRRDFEALYQDCTTSSRPGRPPKRFLPPQFSSTPPLLSSTQSTPTNNTTKQVKSAYEDSGNAEEEFLDQSPNSTPPPATANRSGSHARPEESSPNIQSNTTPSSGNPILPGQTGTGNGNIYAKAQEALRAHYQHMGLIMPSHPLLSNNPLLGLQNQVNATKEHTNTPGLNLPGLSTQALTQAQAQLAQVQAQAQASHLAREHLLTSEKPTENGPNQFSSFSNVSPTGNDGVTVPTLLEKINYMITDCNQNESILELASKLAIYAAENARKRQRETKDEIENLKSELESERKLRKLAETKAEKTSKASRQLGKLLRETRKRYFRRETVFNSPTSSPEPEKRETQTHEEDNADLKSEYPSITLHSHVELHKIGQKPQII